MTFCTHCGRTTADCECNDTRVPDVDFGDLSYTRDKSHITVPDRLVEKVESFYSTYKSDIDNAVRKMRDADTTDTSNWSLAGGYAIASIETETPRVHELITRYQRGDFSEDKSVLTSTRDGEAKWSALHDWFTAGRHKTVAGDSSESIERAIVRFSGHNPDTGDDEAKTYLRPVKASLVAYILTGDGDWVCMDRRVFTVLRSTGFLNQVFTNTHLTHTDTQDWRMRTEQQGVGTAKPKSLLRHKTADDLDTGAWCDGFARNVREYRTLTAGMMDVLADETDVPRDALPLILFNLGADDEPTFLEPVLDRLK